MSESVWSSQVHARNDAIRAARESRDQAREREQEQVTVRPMSDAEELLRDIHQVSTEAREEKPMHGTAVSRALPDWATRGINALPEGHELRKARDEGRIKYDVRSGRWLAHGVKAPEKKEAVNGHFPDRFFQGTARRQRERQAL